MDLHSLHDIGVFEILRIFAFGPPIDLWGVELKIGYGPPLVDATATEGAEGGAKGVPVGRQLLHFPS